MRSKRIPWATLLWKIVTAPATWIALAVIALGLAAWWLRKPLRLISEPLQGLAGVARNSFGFEAINRTVVDCTQQLAEDLRATQTGVLNWNVLAIVVSLVRGHRYLIPGSVTR